MQFHTYQAAARRTAKSLPPKQAYDHFVMGIISDWGEVVTVVKAVQVYNKPLDAVWDKSRPDRGTTLDNLSEELGDCCWFLAYGCDLIGRQFQEMVQHEIHDLWYMQQSHLLDGPDYWARVGAAAAGEIAICARPACSPGVCLWHMAKFYQCMQAIAEYYGLSMDEVRIKNIAKLTKRYPQAYSDEAAQTRADKN